MANLVKIKHVTLMTGLTAGAADCVKALELLRQSGIKFVTLSYADQEEHHKANFEALSGWPCGRDFHKVAVTDYPVVTYDECWDDFEVCRRIAHGLDAIKSSDVLQHPELCERA